MPFTRSIELREVNALPCTKHELAIAYRDRHIDPGENSFDVRVRISLGVTELIALRDELCEM